MSDVRMRQLSLHASALNDAEYELYTSILQGLVWADDQENSSASPSGHDDAYYEQMRVGAREVRAWIRGRYAHIAPATIDGILRFFSPNMGQYDVFSGGQFFAALRLVVHIESGKELDRSFAFVQAHPTSTRHLSPGRLTTDSSSPPIPSFPASAPPTSQIFDRQLQLPSPLSTNPFTSSEQYSHINPLPQRTDLSKSPTPSSHSLRAIHNPFVKGNPGFLQEKSSAIQPPSSPPKLPPRKPSLVPPPVHPVLVKPRRSSVLSQTRRRSVSPALRTTASPYAYPKTPSPTTSSSLLVPLSPPSLKPHFSPTLMKESLQASKATQTAKKHEKLQEDERVLQVLKSSAVISGGYSLARARVTGSSVVVGTSVHNRSRGQSRSPSPSSVVDEAEVDRAPSVSSEQGEGRVPPLPRRRQPTHQQQPSPPGSVSSFEQIVPPSSPNINRRPTPTPTPSTQSHPPFPPPSPSHSNTRPSSSSNPYHKRPLPIPGSNATMSAAYGSPKASPARSSFDLPAHPDKDMNNKPKQYHFRYRSPSSSSSASFTFINHADAAPPQDNFNSTSTVALSSSPPSISTPAFPFYNPPASPRFPFRKATPREAGPITPAKSPPKTPAKYSTQHLAPSPFNSTPANDAPITPQSESSPTTRIFRSKSLHQPSPPLPPLPVSPNAGIGAVRRKRPESVTVLSSGEIVFGESARNEGILGASVDTSQNQENQHRGAEGGKLRGVERQVSLSNPSPGEPGREHRRLSLSRSISASSYSTHHTSFSQPVPDAYSHSHSRFTDYDRKSRPDPNSNFRDAAPSLSNIQRTIAKFDALQWKPETAWPNGGSGDRRKE